MGLKRFVQPAFCVSGIVLGTVLAGGVAHAEISAAVQASNSSTSITIDQSSQTTTGQDGNTANTDATKNPVVTTEAGQVSIKLNSNEAEASKLADSLKTESIDSVATVSDAASLPKSNVVPVVAEATSLSGIATTNQPQSFSNLGAATHVVMREVSGDFGLMAPTIPVLELIQTQVAPVLPQPTPAPVPAEPTHNAIDLLQKIGTYFVVKPILSSYLSIVHAISVLPGAIVAVSIPLVQLHLPLTVPVSLFLMLLAAAGFGMAARGSNLSFATLPMLSSPLAIGRVSSFYNLGAGPVYAGGAGWVRNKSINCPQRYIRKEVTG